jgi:hypothetical protein
MLIINILLLVLMHGIAAVTEVTTHPATTQAILDNTCDGYNTKGNNMLYTPTAVDATTTMISSTAINVATAATAVNFTNTTGASYL